VALQEGREKENTGCSTFSSYREMFSFGGMAQRKVTAGKTMYYVETETPQKNYNLLLQ